MATANLYDVLGVARDASPQQIEDAFNQLKDLYQQDPAAVGGEQGMAQIEDAYAILSDAYRRADYDLDMTEASHGGEPGQVETIHCQKCDAMPIQPRYLVFWRVFSFILFTNRSPVQGVYCAPCARKEALGATALTGIVGWWGIPWGPIWTIGKGFQNVACGEKPAGVSEALAWQNVVAFANMGDMASAQAGAQHLLTSRDPSTMEAAHNFLEACKADGVPPAEPTEDAWKPNIPQAILRVLLLLWVPIALIAWISTADGGSSARAEPSYYSDTVPVARIDPETGMQEVPVEDLVTCDNPPANGAVLAGQENLAAEGHQLEIDNGSSGNAIVNVRNSQTNDLLVSFYVSRGETGSVSGLADGTYKMQYALGGPLDEDCRMFAGDFSASAFPDPETFRAQYVNDERGEGYIYEVLTFTLYSVPGGNVRPQGIADDAFLAE